MFFHLRLCFVFLIFIFSIAQNSYAESKEIESITVLADSKLAIPLAKLAARFAGRNMISVTDIFGDSLAQKKKIEDGDSGDLLVTFNKTVIEDLKLKGLVDVYSISEIKISGEMNFYAVVLASENMPPAREFLEYMKSAEAQNIILQSYH